MTLCSVMVGHQRFGGPCCLHLQGDNFFGKGHKSGVYTTFSENLSTGLKVTGVGRHTDVSQNIVVSWALPSTSSPQVGKNKHHGEVLSRGQSPVRTSARRPVILCVVFRGFSQSLQANVNTVP